MSIVSVDIGFAEIFKKVYPDLRSIPAALAQRGVRHRLARAEKAINNFGEGWNQLREGWDMPEDLDQQFQGTLRQASLYCRQISNMITEKNATGSSSLACQWDRELKNALQQAEQLVSIMESLLKESQRGKKLGVAMASSVDDERVRRLVSQCKKADKIQRLCGLSEAHPKTALQFKLMDLATRVLGPGATQQQNNVNLLWATARSTIAITDPVYAACELEIILDLLDFTKNQIIDDLIILYLRGDNGAILLMEGCARQALENGSSKAKVMDKLISGLKDLKPHVKALPTPKQLQAVQKSFNPVGTKCSRGWDTSTVDSTGTSVYYDAVEQLRA